MPKEFKKPTGSFRSFYYAWEGFHFAVTSHRSFAIELLAAASILVFGFVVGLSYSEWIYLVVLIFMVLSAELINTAIETTLDHMSKDHHMDVKKAKDVAAAGVLVMSVGAFIIGLMIFLPHILERL